MNKTFSKILLTVAAAATVASCEITRPEGEITPVGDLVLTASLEAPVFAPETRTSLKSDTSTVVWSASDAFALVSHNGSKSRFTLTSGAGTVNGTFSGSASGTAPWYALYPDSDDISISEGVLHFKMPATQTYASGTFASGACPAIANLASASDPLQFKNLCGLLCLQFMAPSITVTKIVVHDLGGNMLWGDCALTLDGTRAREIMFVWAMPGRLALHPCRMLVPYITTGRSRRGISTCAGSRVAPSSTPISRESMPSYSER